MKKNLFLGLAAALAVAGMTSCSNDDVLSDVSTPLETDQSFFANISIVNTDAMTRAQGILGDYEDENTKYDPTDPDGPNYQAGTTTENRVRTIFLIFYDEDGKRVSTTQVLRSNLGYDDGTNPGTFAGSHPSINSLYSGTVQIDVKHGSKVPTQVVAYINPISSMNFDINPEFENLTELQKVTRSRIIDDNGNFAMSKSVYYKLENGEYSKVLATPLGDVGGPKLFESKGEAQTALESGEEGSIVDIYVERYAAKVNFSIADAVVKPVKVYDENGTEVELTFVPEYWAVNAYESDTYAAKSFLSSDMASDLDYHVLNDALGGKWVWNSPANHRSFWAQSPAYYAEKYPRVADDILDKRATNGKSGGYILGYYSYDEMKTNADGTLIAKARDLNKNEQYPAIYARENTVAGEALQKAAEDAFASPKAAIASVVMVGYYKMGDDKIADNKTFYVMGNATNGYSLYKDTEDMLNWMVNTTVRFYKDAEGNSTFYDYGIENYKFSDASYKDLFVIKHPEANVRNYTLDEEGSGLVIDSRFVTIQLDRDKIAATQDTKPIYAYINGEYTKVTPENLDYINQQMLYAAGTAQGFKGGKAYFTIPIKHLGYYRADNPNLTKNANAKDFVWDGVKSGDFGLVRNHVYSIVVDEISGLGNGIPTTSDPIVPPTDPEEYFIGARIIVMNWAVVPTQHETL